MKKREGYGSIVKKVSVFGLLWLSLSAAPIPYVQAQAKSGRHISKQNHVYQVSRLQGTIKLDGWSKEAVWQSIKPLDMTMYMPVWGQAPTEHTEIRLTYDEEYLYVS